MAQPCRELPLGVVRDGGFMSNELWDTVNTQLVLAGQTIAYTIYVVLVLSVMGWFTYRVTRATPGEGIRPRWFWTYAALLVVAGVSLHLLTRYSIPWKELDINAAQTQVDQTFNIGVANHKFVMPAPKLMIRKGQLVRFDVRSADLTYGFGLFRPDDSMVMQMQVVPGYPNQLVWKFNTPGLYTIRSTEYSGPEGTDMTLKDVVVVTE